MAPTLDGSTPAAVYGDTASNTSLVTASFTPPSGSIVVAKVVCADALQTSTTPTGLTFTSQVNVGSGSSTRVAIYTATGGGSAITVTAAFGGTAQVRALIVEVWTGAQLAGTPATHSVVSGSGAPTDTITTTGTGSVVSWVDGDWAAVDGTSRTYRSSATETAYHFVTGQDTVYTAYQAAASAGSQTYGLTAPVGQTYTEAAIEIQAASGGAAPAKVADFRRRIRQFPLPRRRSSSTRTFPPVVLPIPVLPPQASPRQSRRQWFPKPKARQSQPVRPQVVVQTTQALPPQAGRRKFGMLPRPKARTSAPVPPQVVVVTVQALPPQPTRDRLFPQPRRHTFTTTVTITPRALPPQSLRDRLTPMLRRRAYTAAPVPVVVTVTVQPPPQQTRRRRTWLPWRRHTVNAIPVPSTGTVSYSGLVMLSGDGQLSVTGTSMSTSGTAALSGNGTLTISPAGRTVYRFEPPGRMLSMDPTGEDFLWSRVKYLEGDVVIRYKDGSFKQFTIYDPNEPNMDVVYLGGHVHTISDADALLLIQAGYGAYLKVVTA